MKNPIGTPTNWRHSMRAGAVVFAALLVALSARDGHAQPASPVTTDEVIKQVFTQTIPIVGKLTATQSGEVATRIGGMVAAMHVQVGERVTRGQVLATIDTAALELQRKLAEARHTEAAARLQTANARRVLAGQKADRLSGLTDSAAVSKAVYDDARQRQNIAVAEVREAAAAADSNAAAVRLVELDISYARIVAPFDGAITARLTEAGSYLTRGQAVARLVSDRQLELEADIPYDRLDGLGAGTEVEVRLDNGSSHRAIARAVIPEEDIRTRTRRARFTVVFGEDAGLLATEQSVTVLVPAGAKRDIVSVHKDAIVQRGQEKIVFVVADATATIRRVRTGASSGTRLEVLDGLAPGDLVVVRGNERLQPNQKVTASPLQ